MLVTCSMTELHPSSFYMFYFETGSHSVIETGLELVILLPQSFESLGLQFGNTTPFLTWGQEC